MEKRAARPRKPRVIDTRQSIVTMKRISNHVAHSGLAPDLVSRSAEPKDIFLTSRSGGGDGSYVLQVSVPFGKNKVETNLILDGEWADRADLGYPLDGTQPAHHGCTSRTVAKLIAEISRLNGQKSTRPTRLPACVRGLFWRKVAQMESWAYSVPIERGVGELVKYKLMLGQQAARSYGGEIHFQGKPHLLVGSGIWSPAWNGRYGHAGLPGVCI